MFCFCELRVVCGCEGIQSHPRQSSTTAILTKSTIQHVQNVVNFSKFFFLLFLRLFRFSANSNWKVVRGRNLFAIDKRDRIWLFLCVSYSRDRWSEKTLKKNNKINQNVCVRGKGSCVCVYHFYLLCFPSFLDPAASVPSLGFQTMPLDDSLAWLGDHVLPMFGLGRARAVLACKYGQKRRAELEMKRKRESKTTCLTSVFVYVCA